MPGKPPGPIVLGILATLAEEGPMTRAAIVRHLGLSKAEVSSVISRMAKPSPMLPKRIYVKAYTFEDEGSTIFYPRAVYDLGDKPDARRPPKTPRKAISARCRSKARKKVASVWELGMSRRAKAEHRRERIQNLRQENQHG